MTDQEIDERIQNLRDQMDLIRRDYQKQIAPYINEIVRLETLRTPKPIIFELPKEPK